MIDYQASKNCLDVGRATGASHFVLLSAICVQKPLLEFQRAKLKLEQELQVGRLVPCGRSCRRGVCGGVGGGGLLQVGRLCAWWGQHPPTARCVFECRASTVSPICLLGVSKLDPSSSPPPVPLAPAPFTHPSTTPVLSCHGSHARLPHPRPPCSHMRRPPLTSRTASCARPPSSRAWPAKWSSSRQVGGERVCAVSNHLTDHAGRPHRASLPTRRLDGVGRRIPRPHVADL